MGAMFVQAVADLLEMPVMRDGKAVSRETVGKCITWLQSCRIISLAPVRSISNRNRRRMRALQCGGNVIQGGLQALRSDRNVMRSGFAVMQNGRNLIQSTFTAIQSDLKVPQSGRNVIQSGVTVIQNDLAVIQRTLKVIQSVWECQFCQSHLQQCQSQVLQSGGMVLQKERGFKIECFSAQGERIGKTETAKLKERGKDEKQSD